MATRPAQRDLYEILGIEREASADEIRDAYRARARELHPDVSSAPDAEDRFREVTHAYGVLSKPRSRVLYDRLAYRGPGGGGFGPVHQGVGKPTRESAHLSEDELIGWIFTDDEVDPKAPVPKEDRLIRVTAMIALGIAIALFVMLVFMA